ncbi:MAG TPA: hypothetical protein VFQ68_19285, partial [Streptosporangiaceae bacterium]|nr:hypothetical protein [Streptosporangiaceae bacterium]
AATISRMKSRRPGEAGVRALTRLLLVTSIRVVQYVAMSGAVGALTLKRFDEFLGPRLALPAVQLDHPTASGR